MSIINKVTGGFPDIPQFDLVPVVIEGPITGIEIVVGELTEVHILGVYIPVIGNFKTIRNPLREAPANWR